MARLCLLGSLGQDPSILEAAETFNVPVIISTTGVELINEREENEAFTTYFVTQEFEGPWFETLCDMRCRVLGPTALKELAQNHEPLPASDRSRPMYSLAMRNIVTCFTGYRKETDVRQLAQMVHHMGGSLRKDIDRKVTHLIAGCPGGEKYRYARTFGVPVMSETWVTSAWENRHVLGYSCSDANVIAEHKLKFGNARVCFLGFSPEETEHMSQILVSNKGIVSSLDDPHCNYLVVDESNVFSLPETPPPKARVVKAEWFWASVQDEICADEKEYLFEDVLDTITSPDKKRYQSTPISGGPSSRARKRKRLQQKATLSQFESPLSHKRRSSISDAGLLSISGSYLDCTATPEKDSCDEIEGTSTTKRNVTGRYLVFDELVTTETNYVGILDMILKLYKTPLEEMAESNNVLLSPHEVKTIFGKLPAIYEVHKAMLEELKMGRDDWKEEFNIGEIIYKYAEEFQKCYPLFINNLENIKLTLEECDVNRPRFHAFLKRIQNKSESNREPLKDLLIRPVQRLPSIILLLNDLLKRTDKQNPDHRALEKAIAKMKEATSHINENKGKTEMQLAMFDLFNEIENCPPHLISSHRNLISKCECVELTEILSSKKGDILVLLLFTDALEICKKRVRSFNSFRSTKPSSLQKVNKLRKPYKHIRLMPLSNLRKVIDVKESDECRNVFALLCPSDQSLEKNLCSFTIIDESVKKSEFLNQICKQLAQTVCKPNPKDFYDTMDSNDLNVDTASSVSLKSTHSFSTALRFASKTGVKVGRALSISKTPNRLIKAMSTALPFSGHESLPRSTGELARMRLQSCANLNELNCTPPRDFSSPVTPMSVQPTRRNMLASAFSVSSLKLL